MSGPGAPWAVIPIVLPWIALLCLGLSSPLHPDVDLRLVSGVAATAYVGVILWLGIVKGQPILNRFGAPPGEPGAEATAETFS